MAQRVGRFLDQQELVERDAETSYLASDAVNEELLNDRSCPCAELSSVHRELVLSTRIRR